MKKPPDEAHQQTDKELAKLERRIAKVYLEAAKDLEETIRTYFEAFAERDAAMKKLVGTVVNGKEWTEQDYRLWRLAQMARGKRYQSMREQVAQRITKANEVAIAYVNDATPGVYSLNRNYSAYSIEQMAGDVGFTIWDEATVKKLIKEQPDIMPYYPPERAIRRGIDLKYGKQQITKNVTSGILQGKSVGKIANDLQKHITDMGRTSAIRAARTAITGAQNGGRMDSYKAAEDMGIEMEKEWMATLDGRTRHSHRRLDGERVGVDEEFSNGCRYPGDPQGKPGEVYNCFVGDVKVASDSKIIRSYKTVYTGDLITVKTSGGVEFTCTPNHPILTPGGWVPAKLLHDGNDILVTLACRGSAPRVNPNVEHTFPSFDAIHEFLYKFGGKRTCTLSVDFHGDVPTSDVEIITQKRLLRNNWNSSIGKRIDKFLLKLSDKALVCKGTLMKHFRSVRKAPFSLVCRKSKALSFLWRRLSHSDVHRFRSPTDFNAVLPEYSIDNLPTEAVLKGELLDRLPGKVFLDHVVGVEVGFSKCHVYNLQTESGYYFVNSIIPQGERMSSGIFAIAKNCRCTTVARVKRKRPTDRKGRLTYSEWEKQKKSENATAWETLQKKGKNYAADKKQFQEYRKIIGSHMPGRFADFQEMKYNDPERWAQIKTLKKQTSFVKNAPCVTTPQKYTGYFLKPGANHSDDFFRVGYSSDDTLQLRYDMARQFGMDKAVDVVENENGVTKFNIYMELGVTKKRRFLTSWRIDKPGDKPRIITAFDKPEKKKTSGEDDGDAK